MEIQKNIVFIEELVSHAPNLEEWRFTALKHTTVKNYSRFTIIKSK